MSKQNWIELLVIIITGCAYAIIFPKCNCSCIAWVVIIPLLLYSRKISIYRVFAIAWLGGCLGLFLSLKWITETMIRFGGINTLMSFILVFLLGAYLALYIAIPFSVSVFMRHKGWPYYATLPFLWVTGEYLRGILLTGFPWNIIGYSQYKFLYLVQFCDITGVYGVSFVIILVNAVIAEYIISGFQRIKYAILAVVVIIMILLCYGYYRVSQHTDDAKIVTIGVVQGNINQEHKWNHKYRNSIINTYVQATIQLVENNVDLILWPEAATPFYFQEGAYLPYMKGKSMTDVVVESIRNSETYLLFGSPSYDPVNKVYYNSAFFLAPDGTTIDTYRKHHLVPFGEYIPWHRLFFFARKLTVPVGDFRQGKRFTVFKSKLPAFSTFICYETAFPDLIRRFTNSGATFLVNLTNDAWFGNSAGPHQHFSMTVFRAIENRVPVIRCANTGISGYVDECGRICDATPLLKETVKRYRVILVERKSLYRQTGDVFALFATILSFASMVAIYCGNRRSKVSYRKRSRFLLKNRNGGWHDSGGIKANPYGLRETY